MRFRCERCRAKYRIDDSLLTGRVSRIRCRRCTSVMTLRGARAVGAEDGTVMSGPPPQISDIAWFARLDGQTRGPYTEDEIVRLFHDGTLTAHTRLWHDALPSWERFIDLDDFSVLFTPRRRLKAKRERGSAASGTVVDFLKATEPVLADRASEELYLDDHVGADEEDEEEVEADPTDPWDILERSDVEWVSEDDASAAVEWVELSAVGAPALDDDEDAPARRIAAPAGTRESDTIPLPPAEAASGTAESATEELESQPPSDALEVTVLAPLDVAGAVIDSVDPDEPPREGTDQYLAAGGLKNRPLVLAAGAAAVGVVIAGALTLIAVLAASEPSAETPRPIVKPKSGAPVAAGWDEVGAGDGTACLVEGACPEESAVEETVEGRPAVAARAARVVSDPAEAARVRALLAGSRKGPSVAPALTMENALVPDQSALSAEDVEAIIKRGVSAVRFCVERELGAAKPVTGRQVLRVFVEPSGLVERARFESAVTNASPLGECVVGAAKRWRFPAFAGDGVELHVPLVLGG